jgi:hypothetical protein
MFKLRNNKNSETTKNLSTQNTKKSFKLKKSLNLKISLNSKITFLFRPSCIGFRRKSGKQVDGRRRRLGKPDKLGRL